MNYQYQPYQEQKPDKSYDILCMTSLITGILSMLCCNPFYLMTLAAIVTGIAGIAFDAQKKKYAYAGLILSIVSAVFKFIITFIIVPFLLPLLFTLPWLFELSNYFYYY